MTSSENPETMLARLRVLVAFLAEDMGIGVASSGLAAAGQTDLAYVFPRTAALAGLRHVQECLEAHHDETVQSRGAYHLFRLPTALEARIHELHLGGIDLPKARAPALSELDTLADDGDSPVTGSINLGVLDLQVPEGPRHLCSAYLNGFRAGNLVTPFFTLPE